MSVAASDTFCLLMAMRFAHDQPHPCQAPSSRVLRGGSWNNNPENLRSANRNRNNPTNRNNNNGFRLASTLTARVLAFTDAGRVAESASRACHAERASRVVRGAVMRRRRLAGHMGRDGGVVCALMAG
jgi:hypothetical protein